jgi:hypothetical protein
VATSSPFAKFSIHANASSTDIALFAVGSTTLSAGNSFSTSTLFVINNNGNVGVGSSTPGFKLAVTDAVSTAQTAISYDGSNSTKMLTSSTGDLFIYPSGNDTFINNGNLWVCTGGSNNTADCPTGTPSAGSLIVETSIGIATGTPSQALGVAGKIFVSNGLTTNTLGTATSTFMGDVKILGKLDVSTIDPVYTIDGIKYATYGHSTIGIHEETMQTIAVTAKAADGTYVRTINFDTLDQGSDLWLFWQVTDFGSDWQNLIVTLTPGFEGDVHYEKVPQKHELIIKSTSAGEVSMRLTANRYDSQKWPNLRPDQQNTDYKGFILNSKTSAAW